MEILFYQKHAKPKANILASSACWRHANVDEVGAAIVIRRSAAFDAVVVSDHADFQLVWHAARQRFA
jgi:hypothetical protein